MLIAEKTIKETVGFIVAQFRRQAKAAKTAGERDAAYQSAKSELSGISKLLIGRREHSYTDLALIDLKNIDAQYKKAQAA
jgi:hypothetical protein